MTALHWSFCGEKRRWRRQSWSADTRRVIEELQAEQHAAEEAVENQARLVQERSRRAAATRAAEKAVFDAVQSASASTASSLSWQPDKEEVVFRRAANTTFANYARLFIWSWLENNVHL